MKINKEIDAVDYEQSDLFQLSDKPIRRINKLVFVEDGNKDIFKLKNLLHSVTVSKIIKNKINEQGLKGFEFIPVENMDFKIWNN